MSDTRRIARLFAIDLTSNQLAARILLDVSGFFPDERIWFDMSGLRNSSGFAALLHRFRCDNKANVAVMFGIALVPILTAIGCATDYSLAVRMKAKMLSAADGA